MVVDCAGGREAMMLFIDHKRLQAAQDTLPAAPCALVRAARSAVMICAVLFWRLFR